MPSAIWRSFTALLLLTPLVAPAACGREAATEAARAAVPVRVRKLEPSAAVAGARFSGSIEPATRVDLAFKVGGYVQELAQVKEGSATRRIQEGDKIKAGTVLAMVRQGDYEQRLQAANAALAEALASHQQAELDHGRAVKLAATNAVPQAEVENMGARLAAAAARVDGARARITEAKLALADTALRAPLDAVVLKRSVEVGTLVAPGSAGFVLADTSSVKVVFGAPDTLVDKLAIGGLLPINLEAVPGELSGKITRIAPSADLRSRVFEVEATIVNPDGKLRAGMVASLKVPEATLAGSSQLALPLTAVVRSPRDARGFSVFVVEGAEGKETARMRDVKLGDVLGNAVLVTEGLKAGDRAISMGATLVTDGQAVRVIP